jgi:membrane protease YdiL (CAAX protease family)
MNHPGNQIQELPEARHGESQTSSAWLPLVAIYCTLTFAASWSLWLVAATINDSEWILRLPHLNLTLQKSFALFMIGNSAPGIVAILLGLFGGLNNLRQFFKQLHHTARSASLYPFAILSPIPLVLLMFLAQEDLNMNSLFALRIWTFIRFFLINLPFAPLWEELGWRGYLLPVLSKRFGIGRASLIVGFIWAGWHFAMYRYVLGISLNSYLINFWGIAGIGVVLAVLYSASGNNLLAPVLFHASWNAVSNCVIQAEPNYGLGAVLLEAVVSCVFAGAVWLWWWQHKENRRTPNSQHEPQVP